MDLPTGYVTFLFTDIEASTALWEMNPEAMRAACIRHDELVAECVEREGGVLVRPRGEGDSRFAVFLDAPSALRAAALLRRALHEEPWPDRLAMKVRMALHSGEADLRDGDYYGSAVNRCARLRVVASGGQALLSGATHDQLAEDLPSDVWLRNLGEHRLKDLMDAERVYQLCQEGLPYDYPPLRSLSFVPNNLPRQLTAFIGREREHAELRDLLKVQRLVTVTGSGGVGKTRLSLQLAADRIGEYPEGVWFVELASVSRPEHVTGAVACTLGLREGGACPEAQDEGTRPLADAIGQSRMLLLLDNCEHVVARCAELVQELLRRCPHLKVLVSSRQCLGLNGECAYRLPSLAVPGANRALSLADVPRYDALRFLADRIKVADPAFELTEDRLPALAGICRRLDGIPLALELAAARARVMPLEQIADRLDRRFDLLDGGTETALPRQRTLRALIDWSYDLLCPEERLLLSRLAVFSGGWTLEAAEAVCATPAGAPVAPEGAPALARESVARHLGCLVERSLVLFDPSQDGAGRYSLQETVRDYAWERLVEAGEDEALRARHRDYFVSLSLEIALKLVGTDQAVWLSRLARERENFYVALGWCLSPSVGIDAALKLLGDFSRSWLTGPRPPALSLVTRGLDLAKDLGERMGAGAGATLQSLEGLRDRFLAPPTTGPEVFSDSAGLPPGAPGVTQAGAETAEGLYQRGVAAASEGDQVLARRCFGNCLVVAARDRDCRACAQALGRLAVLEALRGDLERAATLLGAAEGLLPAVSLPPDAVLWDYPACLARLRKALGHLAFEAARARGAAMRLERAVVFALAAP